MTITQHFRVQIDASHCGLAYTASSNTAAEPKHHVGEAAVSLLKYLRPKSVQVREAQCDTRLHDSHTYNRNISLQHVLLHMYEQQMKASYMVES